MKHTNKILIGLAGLLITTINYAGSMTDTSPSVIFNKAEEVKATAGNAANGEKLFKASKCNQCHGTEVYTRKDRKVKTLPALESQVRRCDSNLNTNWFDDEIIDVTAHLNKKYYKFK